MTRETRLLTKDELDAIRPIMFPVLERRNAPPRRDWTVRALIVVCVLMGMTLAAIPFADGMDRARDAINNPHLEGF